MVIERAKPKLWYLDEGFKAYSKITIMIEVH